MNRHENAKTRSDKFSINTHKMLGGQLKPVCLKIPRWLPLCLALHDHVAVAKQQLDEPVIVVAAAATTEEMDSVIIGNEQRHNKRLSAWWMIGYFTSFFPPLALQLHQAKQENKHAHPVNTTDNFEIEDSNNKVTEV